MTVDWHELNAVVTLITAAVPDVGSLPENINTPSGAREVALDLANAFFFSFLPVDKDYQKQTPSLSYLRGVSALQLSARI